MIFYTHIKKFNHAWWFSCQVSLLFGNLTRMLFLSCYSTQLSFAFHTNFQENILGNHSLYWMYETLLFLFSNRRKKKYSGMLKNYLLQKGKKQLKTKGKIYTSNETFMREYLWPLHLIKRVSFHALIRLLRIIFNWFNIF